MKKTVQVIFFLLVCSSLLAPIWVFKELLFPFVTSKAFYFRIAVELALPFYLYLILANKQYRPSIKNPINVAVLLFLFISIFSGFFGVNVLKSFFGNFERMGGVYYLAHLVALYFYIQLLGNMRQRYLKWFLQVLVGVSVLLSLNGLSGWMGGPVMIQDPSLPLRVSSTFGNPIFFPSFLIIPMFLSAYFALQEENVGLKIMYWIFVLLQLLGIYGSGTRGALVGLIVGFGLATTIFLFLTKNKYMRWYGGGAAVFCLAAAIFLFSYPRVLPDGSILRRLFSLEDQNTKARLIQWKSALRGFGDRPLLGTGSENYYVVANKYYDPETYRFDRSWFDKPHNYLLEILVTNGLLGFLAYGAILVFGVWALFKAFQKQFLSLAEFCVVLAGILAYEIQNLTVFDTISASVAFFVLVGFCGYLWQESHTGLKKHTHTGNLPVGFSVTVFMLTSLCVAWGLYASNIQGMKAAKNVNFGFAYSGVDPKVADGYFKAALDSPYNFDQLESTAKYLDFAISLRQNFRGLDAASVSQVTEKAEAAGEKVVSQFPNDAIAWQRLSTWYMTKAFLSGQVISPRAEEAIQKAIALSPSRPEPRSLLARIKLVQNNVPASVNILNDILKTVPTFSEARMQLALIYFNTGEPDRAAHEAERALQEGYAFRQASEVSWLGDYYYKKHDFTNAARVYLMAGEKEPQNADIFWRLANTYAELGETERAIRIAQAIAQVNPDRSKEIEVFINSLQ